MKMTEERRADLRVQFERIETEFSALLNYHEAELTEFHRVATEFFIAESEGKVYTRRPPLGFRLCATGEPLARVAIRPAWSKWNKTLDPSTVVVEFLAEQEQFRKAGKRALKLSADLRLNLQADAWKWTQHDLNSVAAANRLV